MTILATQSVLPEFIKLRWQEPYVSGGLNRKTFKSLPRGIYNGFVVKPGPDAQQIQVVHDDPRGWDQAAVSGFSAGAFDTASGWSIAVHESVQGFNTTISIQSAPGRNFIFDTASLANKTVYAVLDVQYQLGYASAANVKLVEAADLEADPSLIVLAKVTVPGDGEVSEANIVLDDPLYPRVLPFASVLKYGFMSKQHVERLEFLESVSASPVFEYEQTITVDGPQDVNLPVGYSYVVSSDDLWVFKNGLKSKKGAGRDYVEVDRGDGRGEKISWVGSNLREGDRITFRIQQYSAVATSTTRVLDQGTLIEPSTIDFEFQGAGVAVFPNGPRRVRVVIPGGGGGGGAVKSKTVAEPGGVVNFRALHLRADNAVVYCDPRDPTHKFYGLALQNVGVSGVVDIQVAGICEGAGAVVVGGAVGDDLFIAHDGLGTVTSEFPDATSGSIFKVGMLDGPETTVGGAPVDIVFDRGRLA